MPRLGKAGVEIKVFMPDLGGSRPDSGLLLWFRCISLIIAY